MISNLPPYPAMKASGVPWLGQVPEHWELRRTKTLLRERVQKGFGDEPLLAATQSKGVVLKEQYENRTVTALKDLHLLKLVCIGDFVISLRSFQGGIEYAREQGIISPAYTILYPVQEGTHSYLAWLFKSRPYVENLSLYVTGIRQGQNIDYAKLARSELPVPPIPEQVSITRFLEDADRRIRRYIAAKQKLVKLLEEQRRATLHRVITRGVDAKAYLRPSGVEWLGDVPEHWDVRRLHQVVDPNRPIMYGIVLPGPDVDEGVYIVKGGNCESGRLRPELLARTTFSIEERHARSRLAAGDIVFAIRGGVGAAELVPPELAGSNLTQDAARIAADDGVCPRWLLQSVRAPVFQEHVQSLVVGATVRGINIRSLKRIELAVPPYEEQTAIAEYVGGVTSDIAAAIDRARREISFLREYRTRLIADVVTGKLDVREAAARLPDEAEDAEPLESEELTDTDEEFADEFDSEPDEDAA